MQVYTNSMGIEFCAIGDLVLRGGHGVITISSITPESLVKCVRAEIFKFHSTLTAEQYVTLSNAIELGIIK